MQWQWGTLSRKGSYIYGNEASGDEHKENDIGAGKEVFDRSTFDNPFACDVNRIRPPGLAICFRRALL